LRLRNDIKNGIIKASRKHFGNADLYLFGSRVNDSKKGGDIDLFVESSVNIHSDNRHDFLTDIYRNITERSIDLIIKNPSSAQQKIFTIAKKTGIKLC
jgi:predicted nucleotidyltransferase